MFRVRHDYEKVKAGDCFNGRTVVGAPFNARIGVKPWSEIFCVVECRCGLVAVVRADHAVKQGCKSCSNACGVGAIGGSVYAGYVKPIGDAGMAAHHRLRNIWALMLRRCNKAGDRSFKDYGGRGISVCDEWSNSFVLFKQWALANGYSASLTIDRINNDGGYGPSNCRWATMSQQIANRRKPKKKVAALAI